MTTPADLLATLRLEGFALRAEGGSLFVAPSSRLTAEQKDAVRQHKPGLLALLAEEADQASKEAALRDIGPPDWDDHPEGVALTVCDLVRCVDVDGSAEYIAFDPAVYAALLDLAAVRRKEKKKK